MLAVHATTFGGPEVLTIVSIDTPTPGPGQVLIRVESASVNFADAIRRSNGPYPFPTALPYGPGSEVAGTVAALGAGVDGPPVGTPVFALAGSGHAAGSTGYAQFTIADAPTIAPIPPGLSMDEASTVLVAGLTALLALKHTARVNDGDVVVVQGAAGGVGAYAVQIAKALGAAQVIGAVGHSSRSAAALAYGADHVVTYNTPAWVDAVKERTGGVGADIILDMRGGTSLEESLAALAPFGRIVVYGMAGGVPLTLSASAMLHAFHVPALCPTISVFNLGLWFSLRPQIAGAAIGELLGLLMQKQVRVPVGRTMPLSAAAEAHRLIESHGSTGKIVLKPWE